MCMASHSEEGYRKMKLQIQSQIRENKIAVLCSRVSDIPMIVEIGWRTSLPSCRTSVAQRPRTGKARGSEVAVSIQRRKSADSLNNDDGAGERVLSHV